MANNGPVPNYFLKITAVRVLLSGYFITNAIFVGGLAKRLPNASAYAQLAELGIDDLGYRMLRGGAIIACIFTSVATAWGFVVLCYQTTFPGRRAALIRSYAVDSLLALACIAFIALEKTAMRNSMCSNSSAALPANSTIPEERVFTLDALCNAFELNFRMVLATLVLMVLSIGVTTRYYIHRRLADSRADADDWTKDRSPKAKPVMKALQILAAPFRFVWRCICKLCHASENPLQWTILLLILVIPLLLVVLFQLTVKFCKGVNSSLKLLKAKSHAAKSAATKSRPLSGSPSTADSMVTFDGTCDTLEHLTSNVELTAIPANTDLLPLPTLQETTWWKLKPSRPVHASVGSSSLERLLCHTDLFFSLTSHLHGADLRALQAVSKLTRDTIKDYNDTYPAAVRACLCSRKELNPMKRITKMVAGHRRPVTHFVPTDGTEDGDYQSHTIKDCWSCGISVCTSCQDERAGVRVSKSEVRLRSLAPVCSTCYFQCLCYPKGCFRSMSEKCTCTSENPPKNVRALCRDCFKLSYQTWWKKRLRREAKLDADDLQAEAGWGAFLQMQESEEGDADVDLEKGARPRMATHVKTCYCCRERLWWFFGKSKGLRWWRCLKCGLEARDVLMSTGREFT